ncbi:hypothetical protein D3C78_1111520 [compost metagenome]
MLHSILNKRLQRQLQNGGIEKRFIAQLKMQLNILIESDLNDMKIILEMLQLAAHCDPFLTIIDHIFQLPGQGMNHIRHLIIIIGDSAHSDDFERIVQIMGADLALQCMKLRLLALDLRHIGIVNKPLQTLDHTV